MAAGEKAAAVVRLVRALAVPAMLRIGVDEGWCSLDGEGPRPAESAAAGGVASSRGPRLARGNPVIVRLDAEMLDRLVVAPRMIAPADPSEAQCVLDSAARAGATLVGAVVGERLVGVGVGYPMRLRDGEGECDQLVALGVAPEWRSGGLAAELTRRLVAASLDAGRGFAALVTVAERDPLEPLPVALRRTIATRLLRAAGLEPLSVPTAISEADPHAVLLGRFPAGAQSMQAAAVRGLAEL